MFAACAVGGCVDPGGVDRVALGWGEALATSPVIVGDERAELLDRWRSARLIDLPVGGEPWPI